MSIEEYQIYVKEGASQNYTKEIAILGVVGELGELADVIKKETIYSDMSKFEEKYGKTVKKKIKDEIGDVLWQLFNVMNFYGLNINDVIQANVEKLNKRHNGAGKVSEDGGGVR